MSNKNLAVDTRMDVDPQRLDTLIEREEKIPIAGSMVQMKHEDQAALTSYSKNRACNCFSCEFGGIFSSNWPPILTSIDSAGIPALRAFDALALFSPAIA
jgi:hypothetical protein